MLEMFEDSLFYERKNMPQIPYNKLFAFAEYLDSENVVYDMEFESLEDIIPMQDKFHRGKVDKRKASYNEWEVFKPFIMTCDRELLDGHNTYQFLKEVGHKPRMLCFRVFVCANHLIDLAMNFEHSFTEDWEDIKGG